MSQRPDRAQRITDQATRLRTVLTEREQRTNNGDPEHDHGLHVFISQLLATVDKHIAPGQPSAARPVAELVLDAEPLREPLVLRKDKRTRRRDTGRELHSLVYRVLTPVDLLSTGCLELDRPLAKAIRERERARISSKVAGHEGELPRKVAEALRAEISRGE